MTFIVDNHHMSLIGSETVLIYILSLLMGFTCSLIFMHTSYHDNNPLLANLVNIYIYKKNNNQEKMLVVMGLVGNQFQD